jgi:site-specific DNA recombinase
MGEIAAALYARVSSDQQARGNTVASQLAALRERAKADEVVLDPDHAFVDEGHSGSTLVRPALEGLRDAVAGGRIDRIYVLAPDRLARRYAYQVLLVEEFRRANTEVVFLNRAIGGSAEDDLLLQVQGVIAEYERAKILERGRRGRRHAARSGAVSALSGAPYGYRYIGRHAGGGIARLERCEDEARIVRTIFNWIGVDRISLREVCRRLQKMGCSTKTGRVRWDPTTVCGMLRNPVYRGTAMFGRTRSMPAKPRLRPIGRHTQAPKRASSSRSWTPREEWIAISVPALVDEAQFDAAQLQLDDNRKRKREGRRRPGWLLQGLIVCRRCGYTFYGKMARGLIGSRQPADYGYYRCTGTDAHRFGGQATCDNRSVRSDKLEQAVWAKVQAVLDNPERVAEEYRRRIADAQGGGGARQNADTVDGQIARLRRGIDRLIDGYAEGIINRSEFEPRVSGLKQRLGRLEGERIALNETLDFERDLVLVIGRLEDFTTRMRAGVGELDWNGRRDVIRALIRRIEVDHDKVEVVFRVPGRSPGGGGSSGSAPPGSGLPDRQHCGNVHHSSDRCRAAGGQRRVAAPAPLHAD